MLGWLSVTQAAAAPDWAEILSDIIGVDQLTAPEFGQQTVHQEVLLVGIAEAMQRQDIENA
ncbi:hypothetical protein ACOJBM_00960 [Rhizobium beringeri]